MLKNRVKIEKNIKNASRPSTSVNDDKIEKVKKIVLENRRVGITKVAEALNISYWSTQHIVVHVLVYEARRRLTRTEKDNAPSHSSLIVIKFLVIFSFLLHIIYSCGKISKILK